MPRSSNNIIAKLSLIDHAFQTGSHVTFLIHLMQGYVRYSLFYYGPCYKALAISLLCVNINPITLTDNTVDTNYCTVVHVYTHTHTQDTLELLGLSVEASYTLTLEHLPHNLPAPPLSYEHINTLAGSLAETIAHVSTSLQETRSGASSLMVGNQLTDRMMMDPPQSRVVPVQEQSGSTVSVF